MFKYMFIAILFINPDVLYAEEDEPFCLSRYDYDYKMMRKIVTLEQELNNMKQLLDKQSGIISNQEDDIEKLRTENTDKTKTMQETPIGSTGSTYVRWGRTECLGDGTEKVYSGYAGGSYYTHTGAAADYLCLPTDPMWGEHGDGGRGYSYVYGAEYELPGGKDKTMFKKDLYENDVPCAVCRSSRSSNVMIPARNVCYSGWTMEYTGYLMSGYHGHNAATEYACMDKDPEVIPGGHSSLDGKLFYLTEAHCGSLRCPPYVQGRKLSCVVCSK